MNSQLPLVTISGTRYCPKARSTSNLIFYVLCLLSFSAQSQSSQDRIKQVENGLLPWVQLQDSAQVRYSIQERMKFYKVPAVSIAVINQGQIEWAQAYGLADVEQGIKAMPNTQFQAASLSKSVNALCIMKLVEEGKLSLDTDIRSYLKSWSFPDNELSMNQPITLASLLSHTAGLNVHGFAGYSVGSPLPTLDQTLNGLPPANNPAIKSILKPNTKYQYSGGGIVITKKILEDRFGVDYSALLTSKIFMPLGMPHSKFAQPLRTQDETQTATGYQEGGKPVVGKYHIYPEQAPDGLWTTPTDMARFILAIQRSLSGKSGSFLSSKLAKRMLTPVLDSTNAGLGLFITKKTTEPFFTHNGSNAGFNCDFYGSFSTGQGAIVMVNSDSYEIIDEILNSIATVYNWKGFYKPTIKKLVTLSDMVLARYPGGYTFDDSSSLSIRRLGNHLEIKGQDEEEEWQEMYFTQDNEFFVRSNRLRYVFLKENGSLIFDTLLLTNGRRSKKARKENANKRAR